MSIVEKTETAREKYFAAMDRLITLAVIQHAKLSELYSALYELVGAQIGYSAALREYAHASTTQQAEQSLLRARQVETEVTTIFPTLLGYYSRQVLSPDQSASDSHQAAAISSESLDSAQSAKALEQTMEHALTERERAN